MFGSYNKGDLFSRKARGETYSNHIQRVFLSCNTSEADREVLIADLHSYKSGLDCLVSYVKTPIAVDEKVLEDELKDTDLLVLWVTSDLSKSHNLPVEYTIARKLHIPILPIAEHRETFSHLSGELKLLHGIARNDFEYERELKTQLEYRLVSDELRKEILEKAFSAKLFLGYRSKEDRQQALDFMRVFHDVNNFEAVSIWYDRFLHSGDDFEDEIKRVIHNCDVVVLLLTPNLVAGDNFVSMVEYPCAIDAGKPVISVETSPTDLNCFRELFPDAENPVNSEDIITLSEKFGSKIAKIVQSWVMDSERAFLLGKAYWSNLYVERDVDRAIKLFEASTKNSNKWALLAARYLSAIYRNGIGKNVDYTKALSWQKNVVNFCKEIFGKEQPDTATAYSDLAVVYREHGQFEAALKWHFKTLVIRERVFGKEHPDTANTYNNIAVVYEKQNQFEAALEWYNKALDIKEKILGKERPDTANTYNNIAVVYEKQNQFEAALEWYNKALDIYERVLGEESLRTATAYNNIGIVYGRLDRFEDALKYFYTALVIRDKMLSEDHPDTATTYDSIASVYYQQGLLEEALELYFTALAIRKMVLGKDHIDTASTYNNIANLFRSQKKYHKALEWYEMSMSIREKVLGKEHKDTVDTNKNIL